MLYGDADSWRPTWYGMRFPCQHNQQTISVDKRKQYFPWIRVSNKYFPWIRAKEPCREEQFIRKTVVVQGSRSGSDRFVN
jgi:hypothetical protein